VQRRHQKVVEVAPAVSLERELRDAITGAAVRIARQAGYYNAGTVEFLVDADTQDWFFIEVNPRVQVEHTVTEMVTGLDIVRAQIQVAMGYALHGPEMNLPKQEDIPLYGYALQCRITTEDPANNFTPDYGKLQTYRSPAGFGIRLDGASAYGGAVITPSGVQACLPAHGPRVARVSHSRRQDQHPVPRERRKPSRVSGGHGHHAIPG
jgi:pyruvate carboxylase